MSAVQELKIYLSKVYDPRRNEKQMQFHRAPETYKLFGGALGVAKDAVHRALIKSPRFYGAALAAFLRIKA